MSDDRTPSPPHGDLAAEHALGLLIGEQRRRAKELADTNEDFRADVARWSGRLAPLLDEVEPVPPPASAWSAVEARLGAATSNAESNVVQLHRSVRQWRAATAGMTALAASLALFVLVRPASLPLPGPQSAQQTAPLQSASVPMVAMLGGSQNSTKVMASWDPAARQLVLAVAGDMPADPNHAHELWVIPPGGKPSSLGTMPARKRMHMRLADTIAQLLQQGATIAISVEPMGGSPTGAPTGAVIASGALSRA